MCISKEIWAKQILKETNANTGSKTESETNENGTDLNISPASLKTNTVKTQYKDTAKEGKEGKRPIDVNISLTFNNATTEINNPDQNFITSYSTAAIFPTSNINEITKMFPTTTTTSTTKFLNATNIAE